MTITKLTQIKRRKIMALKTDLSDMSITSVRASMGQIKATLKLWEIGDNTVSDPPILEMPIIDNNVKIYVAGETPDALAARIKRSFKNLAQSKIDYLQSEGTKIDNVTSAFQTMITEIDGELTS